jgi:hypothetical protein
MAKKFLTSLKLVNLPSDPSVGSEGELYFNSSASVAKIYQAGAWSVLGAGAGGGTTVSTTEPASPEIGDSWYKNDTGEFYVYDGTYWVEVNGVVSLSEEQVQDYVAPLFTHGNHTNASVTYDDALNELHIDVTSAPTAGFTSVLKHDVRLNGSIAKGQAVYVTSANGTNMIVSKASNTSEATSSKTLGLLETGGSNNALVKVVTEGLLAGLDTSTAGAEGDPVWLGTDGNLIYGLANKPYAPAHLVFIGIVTRKNNSNGEIFVKVQNGFELKEIHDVGIGYSASIQNNEVLAYDSSSGLWINQTAEEANLATRNGWEYDNVINIRSYDGITDGSINLESYLNAIRLSDDNGVIITTNSGSANFTFNNNGQIQFPDSSIQDTAFLGMSAYYTDDLPEGSLNLYFTNERAVSALTSTLSNYLTLSSASTNYQPLDADLTAISGISGTSGFLKTSGSGSWTVDSNTYITSESDPVFTASDAFNITSASTSAWNASYGWGDHSTAGYSSTSHNHSVDSLSNVVITGTPTDGQALVWDTSTSKWINETVVQDLSSYLTSASAASIYQPIGSYLTSESDTLETVTDRGATSTNAITISNTTEAISATTGALIVSGGVGVAKDLWIDGNLHVAGTTTTENTKTVATHDNLIYLNAALDSAITNAVFASGSITYTAENLYTAGMDIRITGVDPAGFNIASGDNLTVASATPTYFIVVKANPGASYVSGGTAHAKEEANPDLGFAGGYYDAGYAHAGLFRDASDGTFKFFDGYTPEPDEAVNIDTGHVSFSLADISASNAYFSGSVSGTWNGSVIPTTKGGTGLSSIGTAGQALKVNSTADGLEWGTVSGGGGSSAAAVTSDPPASPELNQVWQDLDTGRIYVWNGDFWIEVQQNGSLGLLRYLGAASTAPVTSIDGSTLQTGEVYFDTVFNGMKVYDGTAWEDAFSAASLSVSRWVKTAIGGETSLSGNDDSSLTLVYTPGIEEVYLNGVKLIRGSDYIASSGSVISNLEPLIANSIIEVISYSGFELANTYTKTEVDNLVQKQQVRWTEVAGAGTSITTLSGTDDYSNILAYTPGTEQVFVNGILMVRGVDYTATNGTSVVLSEALSPGDVVEVMGNSTFSVANTYTKAEVDNKLEDFMMISLSDEISTVVTGSAKVTMRAPFAMTLTQIPRASVNTASSSGIPTIDIKKNGTTILGANKLTIDANEKTSVTAATATTLATTAIANDDEITFDVTVSGTGAKGLKVVLYYTRA